MTNFIQFRYKSIHCLLLLSSGIDRENQTSINAMVFNDTPDFWSMELVVILIDAYINWITIIVLFYINYSLNLKCLSFLWNDYMLLPKYITAILIFKDDPRKTSKILFLDSKIKKPPNNLEKTRQYYQT